MRLTFNTMKTRVGQRIQKQSADYKTKIGNWLNGRYQDVLSRKNWPQLNRTFELTLTADQEIVSLPQQYEYITHVEDRTNDRVLVPYNISQAGRRFVDIKDVSGQVFAYVWEGVSVNDQPSSASVIAVSSSNAADTSQKVRIWGEDNNGAIVTESVSLNGTSAVNSTNTYARVDRVTKDGTTTGRITGTSNSAAITVFTIYPDASVAEHQQIRTIRRPDSALVLTVTGKVVANELVNAEDAPILPCEEALLIGAYADALKEQRQFAKAKSIEMNPADPYDPSTYEGRVRLLLEQDEMWAGNVVRMQPELSPFDIDRPLSY